MKILRFDNFINEAYTPYEKNDDILPLDVLTKIKDKLNIKQFKRLGSGKYGTAFKISATKVLKITKDLKEYEYAKQLVGLKNEHIADIYNVYYFEYNKETYAIIIKEYCKTDEHYFDRIIDKFLEYTGNTESLWYIMAEYLKGDLSKKKLDKYFADYKKNGGTYDSDVFYDMIMELKSKNIYIRDLNGSNIGLKPSNNKIGIIELGLGHTHGIKLDKKDKLEL